MTALSRRHLLASAAAGAAWLAWPDATNARAVGRVLVVGAGPGGLEAASALRAAAPEVPLTVVDRHPGRDALELVRRGGTVRRDDIAAVDWATGVAYGENGAEYPFERLVLAPGIDFDTDAIDGWEPRALDRFPHGWTGAASERRLMARIEAMDDGGTVIICAPPAPSRWEVGPYQRATALGRRFAAARSRSKVLILDAKDDFPDRVRFQARWRDELPAGLVEWVPAAAGGAIDRLDVAAGTVSGPGGTFAAAVINYIPPQRAGAIALACGLADRSGWCPVDPATLISAVRPAAMVIGDSARGGEDTKSAADARAQAHRAVRALVS